LIFGKGLMNNSDIVRGFDEKKDDSLRIKLQKVDEVPHCLVIYLIGYIDGYNRRYFRKQMDKVISAGFIRLVFDLAKYEMGSSVDSYYCFIALKRALEPRGGDIVLVEMKAKVCECYQLLGASQFLNIKENISQAVAFLRDA
jgi:anti-anti-sigma regulatory factor